jgi:hypothetical protein
MRMREAGTEAGKSTGAGPGRLFKGHRRRWAAATTTRLASLMRGARLAVGQRRPLRRSEPRGSPLSLVHILGAGFLEVRFSLRFSRVPRPLLPT